MAKEMVKKLVKKIYDDVGLECYPSTFHRTRAGKHQKSAGAFVWIIEAKGYGYIGSIYPASECIKKEYKLALIDSGDRNPEIITEKTNVIKEK